MATMNCVRPFAQSNEQTEKGASTQQKVSLASLSTLTGFPIDFIKGELLLEKDHYSLDEFREKTIQYIERRRGLLRLAR